MTVPEFKEFIKPTLNFFADGEIHSKQEIYDLNANFFKLDENDLNELTGNGGPKSIPRYKDRTSWAIKWLSEAELLKRQSRGKYFITGQGLLVVKENPPIIDEPFLLRYESFCKYRKKPFDPTSETYVEVEDNIDCNAYSDEDFLKEVYISQEEYDTLKKLIGYKKNIIIQGAPGVGKTFLAKRLAYSIMGERNSDRVVMIQFHQSYSYEDFVMGYRPFNDGFKLEYGPFYNFCKVAEDNPEDNYFFIIDEINRGNISKIFGELFMLIEGDKRGEKNKIQLLYSEESFFIPDNVHIIGLMNTADRSLAMIDYALRRRFAFFDLKPGFASEGFKNYQNELNEPKFNNLVQVMVDLNNDIKNDENLGEGFRIGHSYLCNIKPDESSEKLNYIVEFELIPLLKEYWFDELDKVSLWSEKLRSAIDD